MNLKRSVLVVVVLVALIVAGASLAYAQSQLVGAERIGHSIAGSWMITVIPDPASGVPPFVNYSAHTKDGMVIGSNETGHASIGVWSRAAGNQFAGTFVGFEVYEGQTIHYKVRAVMELSQDGEAFTGPFVNDISDVEGNPLFTVTGTVQGTRLHVEPMD